MTYTFQFEFIASFESYQSWTYVLSALIWKNQHNVKTVNVVARSLNRFVGQVCHEISRGCSESILMKISEESEEILKKFVRVISEIYKKALQVQILNEVALRQVMTGGEKTDQFLRSQERKCTKISQHRNMILSSILTLLKNNLNLS